MPVSTIEEFLKENILFSDKVLNESTKDLSAVIQSFLALVREKPRSPEKLPLIENAELESAFFSSTAFAFTIWQYFAALERISTLDVWQNANAVFCNKIKSGEVSLGLGLTHFASPAEPVLKGERQAGHFVLNGHIPWATGFSIFTHLLIGFEDDKDKFIAIIPFEEGPNLRVEPYDLSILNSSSTVRLHVKNFLLDPLSIVTSFPKTGPPSRPPSRYVIPELGIAKRALEEAKKVCKQKPYHPRTDFVLDSARKNEEAIRSLEQRRAMYKRGEGDIGELIFLKDELIRKTVRLLALASGGSALINGNVVSRLQLELLLFDAVIQSPALVEMKIRETCILQN